MKLVLAAQWLKLDSTEANQNTLLPVGTHYCLPDTFLCECVCAMLHAVDSCVRSVTCYQDMFRFSHLLPLPPDGRVMVEL